MTATLILATPILGGCGDDGGTPPTADAAASPADADPAAPDADPAAPDAAPAPDATATHATPCGGDSSTCDFATQICVNDMTQNESCMALPSGCDGDRTCATCSGLCTGALTCFDLPQENTIACH